MGRHGRRGVVAMVSRRRVGSGARGVLRRRVGDARSGDEVAVARIWGGGRERNKGKPENEGTEKRNEKGKAEKGGCTEQTKNKGGRES